jgi:hypothetical protein
VRNVNACARRSGRTYLTLLLVHSQASTGNNSHPYPVFARSSSPSLPLPSSKHHNKLLQATRFASRILSSQSRSSRQLASTAVIAAYCTPASLRRGFRTVRTYDSQRRHTVATLP